MQSLIEQQQVLDMITIQGETDLDNLGYTKSRSINLNNVTLPIYCILVRRQNHITAENKRINWWMLDRLKYVAC